MQQINFRLDEDEKYILELLAKHRGQSVAEFTRNIITKELVPARIELAFHLFSEKKIGFKRCWKISGLSYHEFINEWIKRGMKETFTDEFDDTALEAIKLTNSTAFLKEQPL